MSEHERMISQEGIPIKFLIAHLPNPMAQGQLEDKGGSELC